MQNKPFATEVIEQMKALGWSARELSRRSGVSYDVINKMKHRLDSTTSADNARKLADALGLNWFTGSGGFAEPERSFAKTESDDDLVPVYNVYASAGHGAMIDGEEIAGQLAFPSGYLRHVTKANPKNLAIISVKGDSMLPTLKDDDLVMVDKSKMDLSYDGLFVLRDGGNALLVKRITRASQKDHILIKSDNAAMYPPIERHLSGVEVVGKVVWMGVKV